MENTSAKTNDGIRRRIGSKRERRKGIYETKERQRATRGIQKGGSRKKESAKGEMRREEEKEKGMGIAVGGEPPVVEVEVMKDMWSCVEKKRQRQTIQREKEREDRHTRID